MGFHFFSCLSIRLGVCSIQNLICRFPKRAWAWEIIIQPQVKNLLLFFIIYPLSEIKNVTSIPDKVINPSNSWWVLTNSWVLVPCSVARAHQDLLCTLSSWSLSVSWSLIISPNVRSSQWFCRPNHLWSSTKIRTSKSKKKKLYKDAIWAICKIFLARFRHQFVWRPEKLCIGC